MAMEGFLADRELLRAAQDFMGKMRPADPPEPADFHCIIQEFDAGIQVGDNALLVISKPCVLFEWSLDAFSATTVAFSVQWSPWVTPRNWQDMVGSGVGPQLRNASNGLGAVDEWKGPRVLQRRDAMLMTVTEVDTATMNPLTVVFYMKELPPLPGQVSPGTPPSTTTPAPIPDTAHQWAISITSPAEGDAFSDGMPVNGTVTMDSGDPDPGTGVHLVFVDNTTSQTAENDATVSGQSWSGTMPWRTDVADGDNVSITAFLVGPSGSQVGQAGPVGGNAGGGGATQTWDFAMTAPQPGDTFTDGMDITGTCTLNGAAVPNGTTIQLVLVDNTTSQTATGTGQPYPVAPDGLIQWSGQMPWRSDIAPGDDLSITANLLDPGLSQVASDGPNSGVAG